MDAADWPLSLLLGHPAPNAGVADYCTAPWSNFAPPLTLLSAGLRAASGEEWAEIECLSAEDAAIAGVTPGTPFLRTRRLVRDAEGEVIEYVVSLLDPKHFALHLEF